MDKLQDLFGRKFEYLRLSLTDACNFRCSYCLPNGYECSANRQAPLSCYEIENLVSAFSELGVRKIRLTGGEPTLRRDLSEIISKIRNNSKIKTIALTTNGFLFPKNLKELKQAGLTSLNISVDSLHREKFFQITGHDRLVQILEGVDLAQSLDFDTIKFNAVLLKNLNSNELPEYLEFIRNRNIEVRFIELMRTGDNQDYYRKYYLSPNSLIEQFVKTGWREKIKTSDAGPAQVYEHSEYKGSLGFISPYSKDFCAKCNRLRVSSYGSLRLCLFGQGDISLRELLQSLDQKEELVQKIKTLVTYKKKSHRLHEGYFGDMNSLSCIGG